MTEGNMNTHPDSEQTENSIEEAVKMMVALAQRVAFPSRCITRQNPTENQIAGYSFEFGNPWYTAQPVSTVKGMKVRINDFDIDSEDISLIIRDQKIPVTVARTMHELWWGFSEVAQVFIEKDAINKQIFKAQNDLEVTIDMRSMSGYGIPGDHIEYVLKSQMGVDDR